MPTNTHNSDSNIKSIEWIHIFIRLWRSVASLWHRFGIALTSLPHYSVVLEDGPLVGEQRQSRHRTLIAVDSTDSRIFAFVTRVHRSRARFAWLSVFKSHNNGLHSLHTSHSLHSNTLIFLEILSLKSSLKVNRESQHLCGSRVPNFGRPLESGVDERREGTCVSLINAFLEQKTLCLDNCRQKNIPLFTSKANIDINRGQCLCPKLSGLDNNEQSLLE